MTDDTFINVKHVVITAQYIALKISVQVYDIQHMLK